MRIEGRVGSVGQSFDIFKHEVNNRIFKVDNNYEDTNSWWVNRKNDVKYKILLIENQKSLFDLLNFSASAAYGSLNAKVGMNFEASRSILDEEYSLNILINIEVEILTRGSINRVLLDEPLNLIKNSPDISAFVATYGTGMITSETIGGRLMAVQQISSKSRIEKENTLKEINGSFGDYKAHASFATALSNVLRFRGVSKFINQSGVDVAVPAIDNLVEYSENFNTYVIEANKKSPRVLFFEYQDFTSLVHKDLSPKYIEKLHFLEIAFNERDIFLSRLLDIRSKSKSTRDSINRLLAEPAFPFEKKEAEKIRDLADNVISECDNIASRVANSPLDDTVDISGIKPPIYLPVDKSPPLIPMITRMNGIDYEMDDWATVGIGSRQENIIKSLSVFFGPYYSELGLSINYSFYMRTSGADKFQLIGSAKDGGNIDIVGDFVGISATISGELAYKYHIKYALTCWAENNFGRNVLTEFFGKNGSLALDTTPSFDGDRESSFVKRGRVFRVRFWVERRAP